MLKHGNNCCYNLRAHFGLFRILSINLGSYQLIIKKQKHYMWYMHILVYLPWNYTKTTPPLFIWNRCHSVVRRRKRIHVENKVPKVYWKSKWMISAQFCCFTKVEFIPFPPPKTNGWNQKITLLERKNIFHPPPFWGSKCWVFRGCFTETCGF